METLEEYFKKYCAQGTHLHDVEVKLDEYGFLTFNICPMSLPGAKLHFHANDGNLLKPVEPCCPHVADNVQDMLDDKVEKVLPCCGMTPSFSESLPDKENVVKHWNEKVEEINSTQFMQSITNDPLHPHIIKDSLPPHVIEAPLLAHFVHGGTKVENNEEALEQYMMQALKKYTECTKTDQGYRVECVKGLWCVEAATKEEAMREAKRYFIQYFADGEYVN